jgi:hypothetical protein
MIIELFKYLTLLYLLCGLVDVTVTLLRWQYFLKEHYDRETEGVDPIFIIPWNVWLIKTVSFHIFLWPIDLHDRLKNE